MYLVIDGHTARLLIEMPTVAMGVADDAIPARRCLIVGKIMG